MSSEVAKFREQQALAEEAAQQGLSGLAHVGSHEWITARTEDKAAYFLALVRDGKTDEVNALIDNNDYWFGDKK